MKARLHLPVLFAAAYLLPISAIAQIVANPSERINLYNTWVVQGKVTTLEGDPIYGARVEVVPVNVSGGFRNLVSDRQGMFQTDYSLNTEYVREFSFELRVTKKGFLKSDAFIDFGNSAICLPSATL